MNYKTRQIRPHNQLCQQANHQLRASFQAPTQKLAVFALLLLITAGASEISAQPDFPAGIDELVADQLLFDQRAIGDMVPGFSDDIGTVFVYWDLFGDQEFNFDGPSCRRAAR